MASISAQDVKTLRESTGAGMMDCKKVLTEADGDPQKALELLRERGLSKAGKRAGRETSEGTIAIAIEGTTSVMIELGCETDFVAKTDDFQGLANEIATAIMNDGSAANVQQAHALKSGDETIEARVTNAAATMGENISLKRVERVASDTVVGSYIHMGGKLGVVVALSGGADGADADYASVAKDVAMHVAAIDPTPIAIDRAAVPADLVESEKTILRNQALQSGKPENIVDKIVEGRINKFYAENCLLEQGFVKDPDTTVAKVLAANDAGLTVASFHRFKLGEAATS
ncbi:MAG TPA: elongation factor Ts [Myxococcales bacterium]|nr:elongation factor Ts [Myxococcales bacterium]HIL99942.1 elongation factor Ts [Myxococcales bacterium]